MTVYDRTVKFVDQKMQIFDKSTGKWIDHDDNIDIEIINDVLKGGFTLDTLSVKHNISKSNIVKMFRKHIQSDEDIEQLDKFLDALIKLRGR